MLGRLTSAPGDGPAAAIRAAAPSRPPRTPSIVTFDATHRQVTTDPSEPVAVPSNGDRMVQPSQPSTHAGPTKSGATSPAPRRRYQVVQDAGLSGRGGQLRAELYMDRQLARSRTVAPGAVRRATHRSHRAACARHAGRRPASGPAHTRCSCCHQHPWLKAEVMTKAKGRCWRESRSDPGRAFRDRPTGA